jgi:SAM-dependent methyltransferase
MSTDLADFKEGQRKLWAAGDYAVTARRFEGVAAELVAACGLGPGQRALDLAAGTGNVALAIAASGASPEACDLTPELVAAGRARCEAVGEWEIPWTVADAEELPFGDGRFDAVLSVFGLVFAPRPQVAIAEAFRVTRSGGTVGLTSWTPGSADARQLELVGKYFAAPEHRLPPTHLWGDEATARERLAPHAAEVRFEVLSCSWPLAAAAREIEESNNFVAAARAMLSPERYMALLDDLNDLMRSLNTATDSGLTYDAQYARIVARKPG